MSKQIDYDSLAKQFGANSVPSTAVDYDTLAKQHGGISSGLTPNINVKLNWNPPDNQTSQQVADAQSEGVLEGTGLKDVLEHPLDTAKKLGAQFVEHPLDSMWDTGKGIVVGSVMLPYNAIKATGEQVIPNIVRNAAALREAYGGPPSPFGTAPTQEENIEAAKGAGQALTGAGVLHGEVNLGRAAIARAAAIRSSLSFKPPPIPTIVRALTPSAAMSDYALDTNGALHTGVGGPSIAPSQASTALDELGQYADTTKTPIRSTIDARKALQTQAKTYIDMEDGIAKKILNPRGDIEIPGAGQALAQAKIAAIPEYLKTYNPAEYQRFVNEAQSIADQKLTISDIDEIRQGVNAKYQNVNIAGQVAQDQNIKAIDLAAGDAARRMEYNELNKIDPLHGTAFQEANRRVGAILRTQDLIEGKINQSIAERQSPLAKVAEAAGAVMRPGVTAQGVGLGRFSTIDADLESAIKRWKGRPEPIPLPKGQQPKTFKPSTIEGAQSELLPSGAPNEEPLLAPPPGTSRGPGGLGEQIFKVQQRADQAARSAPPPNIEGTQAHLPGANVAKPTEPFYPGKSGVVHEQVGVDAEGKPILAEHDYTNQSQLFSHYQTPYRWKPSLNNVSSTQDLKVMASEIQNHLNSTGPSPYRKQWEADLTSVRNEIYRRQQALRTPGAFKATNSPTPE